ncbi:DUF5615 family PIN-like protein [Flavobacterium sp.]|uniref:DUF5615 family PIN-like protein n=1 Tax=Flavobacterium sp. TaxID=239 RepID=UPI003750A5D0
MRSFLVDVNLPKYFSYFKDDNFLFVSDLNLKMSDSEIWNYALNNQLIILTKDVDFFNKFSISEVSPKIIYFKIGNLSLKELHVYFNQNWIK